MADSVNPDQTIGAVCSGSTLFASLLNSSVMLGNYCSRLHFQIHFFLGVLMVRTYLHFQLFLEKTSRSLLYERIPKNLVSFVVQFHL